MSEVEPGRRAALFGGGFIVLLLLSEGALTLPDEGDTASFVAQFYADHRIVIVLLQLVGLLAAGLLVALGARLRSLDEAVGITCVVTGGAGCLPGLATIILAGVADPAAPDRAAVWNQRLPVADDVLFVAIAVFGLMVMYRLRHHRVLAGWGGLTALCSATRLGLEAAGGRRGLIESLAAMAFLVLIGGVSIMCWRGTLRRREQ